MPVYVEFRNDILFVTISGESTDDQLSAAVFAGYANSLFTPTTSVLLDARLSKANPSGEEVRRTCSKIIGRRPAGHSGKWALVTAREPLQFGIGRMRGLTMTGFGVPMEVFTDVHMALAFLQSSGLPRESS